MLLWIMQETATPAIMSRISPSDKHDVCSGPVMNLTIHESDQLVHGTTEHLATQLVHELTGLIHEFS